eukprot:7410611-Pyramimonas_sp.AAC.1
MRDARRCFRCHNEPRAGGARLSKLTVARCAPTCWASKRRAPRVRRGVLAPTVWRPTRCCWNSE